MTCKEEKKTDTHDQSAQAFISTAELFLEEDAVWSKYLFNWSSGWVIPSLGRVPLVPNVITRFLYVFCWEMWMSDRSVGAFLWKISVQSHTYTSLHVLIVILRVSLDDRWHFFFVLEMHKILYFWNCNRSSSMYCAQTGGGQRSGTLVMWKHVCTSLCDGQSEIHQQRGCTWTHNTPPSPQTQLCSPSVFLLTA